MKTKFTLLSLFLTIVVGNTMAQDANQAYTDTMNAIFQQIDKSKITTGLLADYGLQIVDPEAFNGIPSDSNYVDMDTWKMLYGGIYTSKINTNANLTLPETVFAAIDNTQSSAVPLAMMHYQYNKLNDNAVSFGLLKVVNNQLVPVAGAASPYLTKQLFAVAPQSLYFETSTASFVFMQATWFSNSGKTVQKLEINFNNESGYMVAAWNTAVSYTFSSEGQKTIYFRLTYTDGSSYTSHTNIIVGPVTSSFRSGSYSNIDSVSIAASSLHSGGKIQISYASSNTSGQLKKPLIVAEGFDAYGIMPGLPNTDINDFLNLYNQNINFGTINFNYSGGNLMNNIDISQYDIVYLDYNKGTDDIRRNAKLFEEVINWVNTHKTGGQPNVVMGLSMGGLVARIALRQMEVAGKDHQTWKYISVDSPHQGANVPVSVQAMVRHLGDQALQVFFITVWKGADIAAINDALKLLDSPAAKQMLIYYVNSNLKIDNSAHANFQQAYDQLGFPQHCQNIATSNGSGTGSVLFAPGNPLFSFSFDMSLGGFLNNNPLFLAFLLTNKPQLAINAIPGSSHIYFNFQANALGNKISAPIYTGHFFIHKKVLGLISVDINITTPVVIKSTTDMLAVDGAPGGIYSMSAMGLNLSGLLSGAVKQSEFCFVPTVSALGLSNWKDKLNSNLQNEDFYASGTSDFDQYFTPATNELHTRLNSSAQFLYTHLTSPMFYFSPNVLSFCGTNSSAINNPSNYALTWSVSPGFTIQASNNTSATVVSPSNAQTGILTCKYNFSTTVRQKLYSTCNLTISGPSSVCPGTSGTFTAENFPGVVIWTCSSNLDMTVNGNTVTVISSSDLGMIKTLTSIQNADTDSKVDPLSLILLKDCDRPVTSWVRATVAGTTISAEKTITTNRVCITSLQEFATRISPEGYRKITIEAETSEPVNINWTIIPIDGLYSVISNNSSLSFEVSQNSKTAYTITATSSNTCGTSTLSRTIGSSAPCVGCPLLPSPLTSAYPNPASTLLTIEIDQKAIAEAQSKQTINDAILLKTEPTYDIRLYSSHGDLLRHATSKGGSVQFDVSHLHNGTYYLHVYDGISEKPEIQQIMVKH